MTMLSQETPVAHLWFVGFLVFNRVLGVWWRRRRSSEGVRVVWVHETLQKPKNNLTQYRLIDFHLFPVLVGAWHHPVRPNDHSWSFTAQFTIDLQAKITTFRVTGLGGHFWWHGLTISHLDVNTDNSPDHSGRILVTCQFSSSKWPSESFRRPSTSSPDS